MTGPKIGIAMIAYNAEEIIPTALEPLREHVDEIAIVLGGKSSDGTRGVAEQWATLPVEDFTGEILNGCSPPELNGRLGHFGDCRQQSFDILERAGCEFALVVDTDDQWSGVEKLRKVVERAHEGKFPMTMFPYHYEGGHFVQPRIYRIDSGHWEGPCHNYWEIPESKRVALQTDLMWLEQVRPTSTGLLRRLQNIEISKRWMAENGDNCRLLQHMAKDMMVDQLYDETEDILNRYFAQYEKDGKNDPEEFYTAIQTKAVIELVGNKFLEAMTTAMRSLTIRNHAQSWVLAGEAATFLAKTNQNEVAMLDFAIFCADQALKIGKPRRNLHWHSDRITTGLPWLIKARAQVGIGRTREGLGTLDIGLMVEPENDEMAAMRKDVCRMLGELE